MSQWDFGHGREPTEHHQPQYPPFPYPFPEQQEQEPGYPDEQEPQPGYSYPQQPPYPPDPYQQQPGGPGAAAFPPDDAAYDPPDAYPITYERDEFEGRGSGPVAAPPDSPWLDSPDHTVRFDAEPVAGHQQLRPLEPPTGGWSATGQTRAWYPAQPPGYQDDPAYRGDDWAGQPGPEHGEPRPRGRQPGRPGGGGPPPDGRPQYRGGDPSAQDDWDYEEPRARRWRWLIPAGLAVAGAAVGVAIVMFALGHAKAAARTSSPTAAPGSVTGTGTSAGTGTRTGTGGAAADRPPLTLPAAKSVLAGYTSANNHANAERSAATLAGVETGGSYAIDAGLYTVQAANGAAPYPAFTPEAATYYIPQAEPAGGPRWFAVQVANAFTADPGKVTSTEYLLFTQDASGGWLNAVEPYLMAGADAPQIAIGGDGLATAVSASTTSLAVAPGQLAKRTAAAIDGTGAGVGGADPGTLADRSDRRFWRGKLPTATVTDAHTAATGTAGQTFALLTTDGGALVFYTDAAKVTIRPPAGSALHLTVPGFYSPAQALSRAGLSYLDQFAAVDPPAGAGTPRVIARYSGITGKN